MITKKYKIDEENDLFDEISEKRRQFYKVLEETDISIEHMEKLIGSFEDVFSEAAYHTMMEHKLTMEVYDRRCDKEPTGGKPLCRKADLYQDRRGRPVPK